MKPYRGDEVAELVFTVQPEMAAHFGGRSIHPVLSTWALVHHLEWAARRLLEPHLEAGEEGVGVGVDVRHRQPAPIGTTVLARAFRPRVEGNVLCCQVAAYAGERLLSEGEVFQAVVDRVAWQRRLDELTVGGA